MEGSSMSDVATALTDSRVESQPSRWLLSIATWSLVSLPCFWMPFYFDRRYSDSVDDSRLGLVTALGLPFLGIATFMSIRALPGLFRTLRPYSRNQRYALGLTEVALAGLNLVPVGYVAFCLLIVLFWSLWRTQQGAW